ncbi:MAG: hypothetical protein OXT03_03960 [Alphaproteobacteria bacterium]|nr:hypothetical protein [Alphaproteobacteria bacterium]
MPFVGEGCPAYGYRASHKAGQIKTTLSRIKYRQNIDKIYAPTSQTITGKNIYLPVSLFSVALFPHAPHSPIRSMLARLV